MSLGSLRDTAYAIDSYSLAVFLSSVMSPGQGAAYYAFVDRRTNIYVHLKLLLSALMVSSLHISAPPQISTLADFDSSQGMIRAGH